MPDLIKIRCATTDDTNEILEIYKPYVTDTAITFEYDVPSAEEFSQRIKTITSKYPYLVAVTNGEIVGYAYANTFKNRAAYDWSVESTVYVRRDMRGNGIGTRLYDMLEKTLKLQGILNINACIAYPENEDCYLTKDSVSFHKAKGFSLVGKFHNSGYKFGRWYDMVWMEKCIGEHIPNQPSVKPFCNSYLTQDR